MQLLGYHNSKRCEPPKALRLVLQSCLSDFELRSTPRRDDSKESRFKKNISLRQ